MSLRNKMTDAIIEYMRGINRVFRYVPNWTPGQHRELGDVGFFDRGVFEHRTSLDEFDIEFTVREDPSPADYTTMASRGVDVKFSAKGQLSEGFQAITQAEVGARIEFSHRNAFLFSAPRCREHEIEEKSRVKRELIRVLEQGEGEWKENDVVITALVEAPSATILISESSESAIELRATGDVGQNWFNLGGLGANVEEAWSSGTMTKVIAEERITPLFKPLRVKRDFLERLFQLWQGRRPRVDEHVMHGLGDSGTDVPYDVYEAVDADEDIEEFFEWAYEDDRLADDLFEEVPIDDVLAGL